MNTLVRTVFFEDFIVRWTQGGGGVYLVSTAAAVGERVGGPKRLVGCRVVNLSCFAGEGTVWGAKGPTVLVAGMPWHVVAMAWCAVCMREVHGGGGACPSAYSRSMFPKGAGVSDAGAVLP